jgi:hypothetical protein
MTALKRTIIPMLLIFPGLLVSVDLHAALILGMASWLMLIACEL